MKLLLSFFLLLFPFIAFAGSGWDYSQWPWLDSAKRDYAMTDTEGQQYYQIMTVFVRNEAAFKKAIKDGYDSVPWAQSAPCATTTSAVLEHSLRAAQEKYGGRFSWYANIFGNHENFGPTHNVEIVLYKSGWEYWPLSGYQVQVGIGLLGGRYTWNGTKKHSGHIYTVFGISKDAEILIGDNGGYNHVYRGPGWKAGTEGIWLPPGVEAK